jgi:hypothetical protein
MDLFSHLIKSKHNTGMFSFHLLQLEENKGCVYHLLKPEDNTWMFFLFSIYLSLKTTHECFVHLPKSANNTWMFFYLLKSDENTWMSLCPFT